MQIPIEATSFIKIEGRLVLIVVDTALYSPRAIRRAAHHLTGRGYVHLQRADSEAMVPISGTKDADSDEEEAENEAYAGQLVTVQILSKFPDSRDTEALAGDFLNHLLDETLREEIGRETEPVRNLLLAHALSETALLRPELETALPEEDPLHIAQPDLFKSGPFKSNSS